MVRPAKRTPGTVTCGIRRQQYSFCLAEMGEDSLSPHATVLRAPLLGVWLPGLRASLVPCDTAAGLRERVGRTQWGLSSPAVHTGSGFKLRLWLLGSQPVYIAAASRSCPCLAVDPSDGLPLSYELASQPNPRATLSPMDLLCLAVPFQPALLPPWGQWDEPWLVGPCPPSSQILHGSQLPTSYLESSLRCCATPVAHSGVPWPSCWPSLWSIAGDERLVFCWPLVFMHL